MSEARGVMAGVFHSSRLYIWATVVFSIAITLAGASQKLVSPVDASMRASMARHIVETGTLFPPYYDGAALLDHPPAVWPLLFFMAVLVFYGGNIKRRLFHLSVFFAALAAGALLW